MSRVHVSMMKFPCLQEMPPTEPVEQGDEGEWDTVGEAAGSRSLSVFKPLDLHGRYPQQGRR
jgi:hypothetical protein